MTADAPAVPSDGLNVVGDAPADVALGPPSEAGVAVAACACDPHGWNQPRAEYIDAPIYDSAIADLDGDGIPDVIAQPAAIGPFYVLLVHGGVFEPPVSYGDESLNVTVGDIDGDGHPDVVSVGTHSVQLFRNSGDGTLQAPNDLIAGLVKSIVVADFNGDSNADLLFVDSSSTLQLALGIGSGAVATPMPLATAPAGTTLTQLAIGDVDGDGSLDIVALSEAMSYDVTVQTLFGDGHGGVRAEVDSGFTRVPSGIGPPELADIDGDGKLDLVDGAQIWLGDDSGAFPTAFDLAISQNLGFATGDFNGDGNVDLVVNAFPTGLTALLGDGHGAFHAVGTGVSATGGLANVAIADFNGDGHSDVVAVDGDVGLEVVTAAPDGSLEQPTPTALLATSESQILVEHTAIADVDRDGAPDVIAVGEHVAHVFRGGCAPGALRDDYELGGSPSAITIADVNHDGAPDIVTSLPSVLLNRGDGTFDVVLSATNGSGLAQIADVDGDGNLDVVLTNASQLDTDNALFDVELGRPDGSFVEAKQFYATDVSFALGDVDGDGRADLVVFGLSGPLSFHGNGDGSFELGSAELSAGVQDIVLADVNRDNRLDVVTGFDVYLGNGDGSFGAAIPHEFMFAEDQITVADVNGDHIPDLVGASVGDSVVVLAGVGDGTFVTTVHSQLSAGPSTFQVDISGDGQPDLVSGGLADTLTVYPGACP